MRLEHHVGVHEHEDVGLDVVGELLAGVRLAPPPGRQRFAAQHREPRVAGSDCPYDVGGAVRGAVVEHPDLQVAHPRLAEQRAHARPDPLGLVAHGQQQGDPLGHRRRVGGGPAQPRHVPGRVHGAGDRQPRPGRHQAALGYGRDCHSAHA